MGMSGSSKVEVGGTEPLEEIRSPTSVRGSVEGGTEGPLKGQNCEQGNPFSLSSPVTNCVSDFSLTDTGLGPRVTSRLTGTGLVP